MLALTISFGFKCYAFHVKMLMKHLRREILINRGQIRDKISFSHSIKILPTWYSFNSIEQDYSVYIVYNKWDYSYMIVILSSWCRGVSGSVCCAASGRNIQAWLPEFVFSLQRHVRALWFTLNFLKEILTVSHSVSSTIILTIETIIWNVVMTLNHALTSYYITRFSFWRKTSIFIPFFS